MKDYNDVLNEQFGNLQINVVKHDTSPTGMPLYIEMHLNKMPKDKGSFALDAGNYIYRKFGLSYQMCPEYRGRGKSASIRWFMSWKDAQPVIESIKKQYGKEAIKYENYLPLEFHTASIQSKQERE